MSGLARRFSQSHVDDLPRAQFGEILNFVRAEDIFGSILEMESYLQNARTCRKSGGEKTKVKKEKLGHNEGTKGDTRRRQN